MVVVVKNSAYFPLMVSQSMDIIAVHGWQAPWVVRSSDEMHGMVPSQSLPSMEDPSVHGRSISMRGMQHARETLVYLDI